LKQRKELFQKTENFEIKILINEFKK